VIEQPPVDGNSAVTTLAQGDFSGVAEPFLLVARDARTYAALRAIAGELPARDNDYFDGHAVVAAFAGQRPSGGYSVEVKRRKNLLVISEQKPAPGSIVTQVLTTPFVVVEVNTALDETLDIALDTAWRKALHTYRVRQGNFQYTGGIAGITEKFRVTGQIQTLTHGDLVTFISELRSVGGKATRRLNNAATGLVNADQVEISYLHANDFVPPPANLLIAHGQFAQNRRQLTLNFEHRPNNIADGFEGQGQLTAVAAARRKQK
jgi:hypothetical protein